MHAAMGSDVLQLKGKVITYTRAFLADPGSDYGDYFNPANEFFNYRCSNTSQMSLSLRAPVCDA